MNKYFVAAFIVIMVSFVPGVIGYTLLEEHIIAKRDAEWSKAAAPIFAARQIPTRPTNPEGLTRLLDVNNDFHRSENGRIREYRPSVIRITSAE